MTAGQWVRTRKSSSYKVKHMAHLLQQRETTCCGKHLKDAIPAGLIQPFNPEFNKEQCCEKCYEWYLLLTGRNKAEQNPNTT